MWSDWLVFCDYGFGVSALWCSLATTNLLRFLLPWTWGVSSRLLQRSAAAAPYLGCGVALLLHHWNHRSCATEWSDSEVQMYKTLLTQLGKLNESWFYWFYEIIVNLVTLTLCRKMSFFQNMPTEVSLGKILWCSWNILGKFFLSWSKYNEILIIIIFLMLGLWGFIILSYVFFWVKIVSHNKSTIKSQ